MSTKIHATVQRSGEWWAVEFALDGRKHATQVKHLDQVIPMVKDAAQLITGRAMSEFDVSYERVMPELEAVVSEYRDASAAYAAASERAALASRRAVRVLRGEGLTMRDIALLMNVSVQRVSKLAGAR